MRGEKITLGRRAEDKKAGMTLGELWAFTQDALNHNIDPRTPVNVSVGFRAQIQRIWTGTIKGGRP